MFAWISIIFTFEKTSNWSRAGMSKEQQNVIPKLGKIVLKQMYQNVIENNQIWPDY